MLRQVYEFSRHEIAAAIEALLDVGNVVTNRPAVEAGLATLRAGGDFADGVSAFDGAWLGGDVFVCFDNQAVALITKRGQQARLLA